MRTDDPLSRRIARAFIDFLASVEPTPDADHEALEVAKDCLREVFRLDQSSGDDLPEPNLLVKAVTAQGVEKQIEFVRGHNEKANTQPAENSVDTDLSNASNFQDNGVVQEGCNPGLSRDEIFSRFIAALEKIQLPRTTPAGDDDHVLLDRAICIFQDALHEIKSSRCKTFDYNSLAEALKTLGNKAMQSKLYFAAVERYTCAIALWENNAVFYCNRAAAYTQLLKYSDAVRDCLEAIEIDPNYSKAYSRLGLAYYAQENYADAINKGFKKALELDPHNDGTKENMQMAERKLKEQQERQQQTRHSSGNYSNGGSTNQEAPSPLSFSFDAGSLPANFASMYNSVGPNPHQGQSSQHREAENNHGNRRPPTFTSIPFAAGSLPADIAGMFSNFVGRPPQGENSREPPHEGSNLNGFDDPGVSIGGNIDVNIAEQMPEELMGTLRSMMGMFQGVQEWDSQGNHHRRSESN
ncbi:hypothetical protein Dimus_024726 [Dionaea muscipula]